MPDLPRPDVTVTTDDGGTTHRVVVSRKTADGTPKGRSYKIEGATPSEKIKDAVEKVLGDGYSREWIP